MDERFESIVIGGGFFGLYLAYHLTKTFNQKVVVFELEDELMTRSSYNNQARVHNGYHYPRHLLTAKRSRALFGRFCSDFEDSIVSDFDKYYAIGKHLGKVNLNQFNNFINRIGAESGPCEKKILDLFDPNYIEGVMKVKECAFDATKLVKIIEKMALEVGVTILKKHRAISVSREDPYLNVEVDTTEGVRKFKSASVFNCTYSMLNELNSNSEMKLIPLKHEITEMALIEVPDELKKVGITVMCGPFFSTMPFPPKGCHTLSHVRYTPHFEWHDVQGAPYKRPYEILNKYEKKSYQKHMIVDTARYLPIIKESKYRESLWEVKTVLPSSEIDDGRPILFLPHYQIKGYHCIVGGKLDNIYDMADFLERLI